MYNFFTNAVKLAHGFAAPLLGEGAAAVDATVGNGHDTLFLARAVGTSGKVYGFDIQSAALRKTAERLNEAGLRQRVDLIQAGHEHMADYVIAPVDVVMFNLGYLPGGDHGKTTGAATTVRAIDAGLKLLNPGGLMTVVVYTGHPGAGEEQAAVEQAVAELNSRVYCVMRMEFVNRLKNPPYLLLIEKNDELPDRGKNNEEPAS